MERLRRTLHLPADTQERVRNQLGLLETFPDLGVALVGRWSGYRALPGPWPWMLAVYRVDGDVVTVLTVQDTRRATSARVDDEPGEGADAAGTS
jgi:hypothetical protein